MVLLVLVLLLVEVVVLVQRSWWVCGQLGIVHIVVASVGVVVVTALVGLHVSDEMWLRLLLEVRCWRLIEQTRSRRARGGGCGGAERLAVSLDRRRLAAAGRRQNRRLLLLLLFHAPILEPWAYRC